MTLSKEANAKILAYLQEAAVVLFDSDCEAMRIDSIDAEANFFNATGEETGRNYQFDFAEIDLKCAMFYKFVLMDTET